MTQLRGLHVLKTFLIVIKKIVNRVNILSFLYTLGKKRGAFLHVFAKTKTEDNTIF
jgi:hypothetical protein